MALYAVGVVLYRAKDSHRMMSIKTIRAPSFVEAIRRISEDTRSQHRAYRITAKDAAVLSLDLVDTTSDTLNIFARLDYAEYWNKAADALLPVLKMRFIFSHKRADALYRENVFLPPAYLNLGRAVLLVPRDCLCAE